MHSSAAAALTALAAALCLLLVIATSGGTEQSLPSALVASPRLGTSSLSSKLSSVDGFVAQLPSPISSMLDTSSSPCTDFHEFACGGWEKAHPPTEHHTSTSTLHNTYVWLLKSLRDICRSEPSSSVIGAYFQSCLNNENNNDANNVQPLIDWMRYIDESFQEQDRLPPTMQQYALPADILGELQKIGVSAGFSWRVEVDTFDAESYLFMLSAGGFSLHHPYLYSSSSPHARRQREGLAAFYAEAFLVTGSAQDEAEAHQMALQAIDVEAELASHAEDTGGGLDSVGPMWTMPMIEEALPRCLDWRTFFATLGAPDLGQEGGAQHIHLHEPNAVRAVCSVLSNTPRGAVKAYLKARTAFHLAPFLPSPPLSAAKEAIGRGAGVSVSGSHEHREAACTQATRDALPMRMGKAFVDRFFGEEVRQEVKGMTERIRLALRHELETSQWMSPTARAAAVTKLQRMVFEVGWPSVWELEDIAPSPSSYVDNYIALERYRTSARLALVGTALDARRWQHSPTRIGAFYVNGLNTVYLPAATLHWPFYSASAPDAHIMGSLGAIVAHEAVHALDSHGRFFDPDGRRRAWWDPATVMAFGVKESCVEEYYDGFTYAQQHLSGARTLAENIADIGGVHAAYKALIASSPPPSLLDRRLFWLSYAQTWCGRQKQRLAWATVTGDSHSPDKFRVIGPLSQSKHFAQDFSCPVGSPMNPSNQCDLW